MSFGSCIETIVIPSSSATSTNISSSGGGGGACGKKSNTFFISFKIKAKHHHTTTTTTTSDVSEALTAKADGEISVRETDFKRRMQSSTPDVLSGLVPKRLEKESSQSTNTNFVSSYQQASSSLQCNVCSSGSKRSLLQRSYSYPPDQRNAPGHTPLKSAASCRQLVLVKTSYLPVESSLDDNREEGSADTAER